MKFITVTVNFCKKFNIIAQGFQKGLFTFFLAFILSTPAIAAEIFQPLAIPAPQSLLVIIYGDELTSGKYLREDQSLAAQLEKKLRKVGFQVNVESMGAPELTTANALEKLNTILGKAPDLVILQLGETDIKRSLSPRDIRANLNNIIDKLKKNGIYVVLMGTKAPKYRGESYVQDIDKTFDRLKNSAALYPYTLEGIIGNEEMTLGDNYHPNAHGIEVIVNGIYPLVDAGLRWKLDAIVKWQQQQLEMRYNR